MCIPFIALIVGLTFFFGRALTNKQHVTGASRYAAWHDVMRRPSVVTAAELDDMFFAGRARGEDIVNTPGTTRTLQDLVSEAGTHGQAAYQLADRCAFDYFPHGRAANVSAEFASTVGLWQRLSGAIHARCARDGVPWRRDDRVYCEPALRDEFLPQLDQTLQNVAPPAEPLAETLRRLYLQRW
jgi:hypothetical protein